MPGEREGMGGEGRKKDRRGGKKSKNTPSVNSCLRPCCKLIAELRRKQGVKNAARDIHTRTSGQCIGCRRIFAVSRRTVALGLSYTVRVAATTHRN